jgi:transcriptional regulator with XRE-family HTH domain
MINLKSTDKNEITGAQIRAARAFIRWSARELAMASGLGVATISRAEANNGVPSITSANLRAIRSAFESAGIRFLSGPNGETGLSFKPNER